ncbi:hypothetical protein Y1Q_0002188 [Alligator mississippiensis]|uniref:Uncharacterized protein n=1 Tax=Alligator mississippiensis TaxID=8496 RepID=A0A151MPV7_ALLMI|nr:hypothetical protein Y1Q_0002188 [Alligator mississippiensis]
MERFSRSHGKKKHDRQWPDNTDVSGQQQQHRDQGDILKEKLCAMIPVSSKSGGRLLAWKRKVFEGVASPTDTTTGRCLDWYVPHMTKCKEKAYILS